MYFPEYVQSVIDWFPADVCRCITPVRSEFEIWEEAGRTPNQIRYEEEEKNLRNEFTGAAEEALAPVEDTLLVGSALVGSVCELFRGVATINFVRL